VPSLPLDASAYEQSIYELLEETHRRPVSSGIAMIEALPATGDTAPRLDVPDGTAILVLSQVHELAGGTPVMYSIVSLRSDVMNLYVHRAPHVGKMLHEGSQQTPSEQDTRQSSTLPAELPGRHTPSERQDE